MSLIIQSLFTLGGNPITGLTPTIKIWEVIGNTKSLIIPSSTMTDSGDGIYLYEFTPLSGFNNLKIYSILVDGGSTLPPNERWQNSNYTLSNLSSSTITNITNSIWDEPKISHISPGSTGEALNEINSDTQQIRLDAIQIINLIEELLKYDKNRTKIDKINNQLLIYDNDLTTVLRRFELRDSNGNLSVDEVCERVPI